MNQFADLAPASAEELKTFLAAKANERWDESAEPYLLSQAGPDFREQAKQFRSLLGEDMTLTRWVETNGGELISVVRHPVQKAKVGIVPYGKVYAFPEPVRPEAAQPVADSGNKDAHRQRRIIVMKFFEALSTLDESDVAKVNIPMSVIAKLMK